MTEICTSKPFCNYRYIFKSLQALSLHCVISKIAFITDIKFISILNFTFCIHVLYIYMYSTFTDMQIKAFRKVINRRNQKLNFQTDPVLKPGLWKDEGDQKTSLRVLLFSIALPTLKLSAHNVHTFLLV